MIHIILHFALPFLVAVVCYRNRWRYAALVMIATMAVDLDHLLADPIYDPNRCSIGYHPLHTVPFIIGYGILFALPFFMKGASNKRRNPAVVKTLHLVGLGLLIHMVLDGLDCFI